jgi:hypothetical protein
MAMVELFAAPPCPLRRFGGSGQGDPDGDLEDGRLLRAYAGYVLAEKRAAR